MITLIGRGLRMELRSAVRMLDGWIRRMFAYRVYVCLSLRRSNKGIPLFPSKSTEEILEIRKGIDLLKLLEVIAEIVVLNHKVLLLVSSSGPNYITHFVNKQMQRQDCITFFATMGSSKIAETYRHRNSQQEKGEHDIDIFQLIFNYFTAFNFPLKGLSSKGNIT
ncbi:unnamed protein product [Brugia pahangi]|uniref:DFP domain-containing protein n=1 Tax=Brugia pahangi TaxID=6280 RepID=A0A0N4TXD8_BRUPA|nr:unnamed protein product [Brugia pahangi]